MRKQDRICVFALAPSSKVKRSRVLYVLSTQVSSEQRTCPISSMWNMPVREGGRVAQVTNNKSGVNCNCPLVHVNEQKGCDSFLFIPAMCSVLK
jgi:hypothetical protein